jgi:peptide-methionine (S)-S-oxide reductase
MSALFVHDERQRGLALESKAREEARRGARLFTEITSDWRFTPAEDYHQKHALRHEPALMRELQAVYPELEAFVGSTAAARLNGYLSGYGTLAQLEAEIDGFGLSSASSAALLEKIARRERRSR